MLACAHASPVTSVRPQAVTAGLVPFTSRGSRAVNPSNSTKRDLKTHAWFNFGKKPKLPLEVVKRETVIPEPSYSIPIALGGITGLSAIEGNLILAGITGFLGAFLAFQASRVQFVFDDEALEVLIKSNKSENKFVGGENRWNYDAFTNWEFWWKKFPVLVYFKESQTKPEGQIHFFPVLFKGNQLYDVMAERCGSSQNSAPVEEEEEE